MLGDNRKHERAGGYVFVVTEGVDSHLANKLTQGHKNSVDVSLWSPAYVADRLAHQYVHQTRDKDQGA